MLYMYMKLKQALAYLLITSNFKAWVLYTFRW